MSLRKWVSRRAARGGAEELNDRPDATSSTAPGEKNSSPSSAPSASFSGDASGLRGSMSARLNPVRFSVGVEEIVGRVGLDSLEVPTRTMVTRSSNLSRRLCRSMTARCIHGVVSFSDLASMIHSSHVPMCSDANRSRPAPPLRVACSIRSSAIGALNPTKSSRPTTTSRCACGHCFCRPATLAFRPESASTTKR